MRQQQESEQIITKKHASSLTPVDAATIKEWVNEALKRGEDWGND